MGIQENLCPHRVFASIIQQHALFGCLPEPELHRLLAAGKLRNLASGDMLFGRGESCRMLKFVISGSIRLFLNMSDEEELTMEVVGSGQPLSAESLFLAEPAYNLAAQAVKPTQILAIPIADYLHSVYRSPQCIRTVFDYLSSRIVEDASRIEMVSLKRASQRVARYLLTREYCTCEQCLKPGYELPVSRALLANKLCIQPETLSRILKKFVDDELILVDGRRICLLEREVLARQ